MNTEIKEFRKSYRKAKEGFHFVKVNGWNGRYLFRYNDCVAWDNIITIGPRKFWLMNHGKGKYELIEIPKSITKKMFQCVELVMEKQ